MKSWLPFERSSEDGKHHRVSHRIDVSMECKECGWFATSGVPVSKEYAEEACAYGKSEMGKLIVWQRQQPTPMTGWWDWSQTLPLPQVVACSWCGSYEHLPKAWACSENQVSLSLKCQGCGLVVYAQIEAQYGMTERIMEKFEVEELEDISWQDALNAGVKWG